MGNNTQVDQVNTLAIQGLKSMLYDINPYANVYRSARELLDINQVQHLRIRILESRDANWRQYVRPTSDEVAALMVGDGFENVNHRDIIISTLDQRWVENRNTLSSRKCPCQPEIVFLVLLEDVSSFHPLSLAISSIPSQWPEDRLDIVAQQLLYDFKVQKMFGTVVADLHVIEFQKRGLPYAHILLTLSSDHKINSAEAIDSIVCAELPN
ncbi:hypothetical protein L1049_020643 [Liquidambar formosana]|uniref:Helitron helicase-like domain-containing protein n=1 Tax=Liquidambar formosana TaxID=63359 RepID=A0AAP0S883_LIQFO